MHKGSLVCFFQSGTYFLYIYQPKFGFSYGKLENLNEICIISLLFIYNLWGQFQLRF